MSEHFDVERTRALFERLYGEERSGPCVERMRLALGRYPYDEAATRQPDEREVVLITYGNSVRHEGESPLRTLRRFLDERLAGVLETVHILPFFPYSSDDGFSVVDYRQVRPALGNWEDVDRIGQSFRLMFDLVLNHCSGESAWFRDLVAGVAPGRHFFHVVEPDTDLSAVVRPRNLPLLTKTQTRHGEIYVWTTFSEDQVDLDFSNPDVLFEFIDILLYYVSKGARIVRLDAIAYLWKTIGTSCIHLEETHLVVKLLRAVVDLAAPGTLLLTETNVPHAENVSYFGDGDEAHMVYQFSLPPLLLHGLLSGTVKYLREWLVSLESTSPSDGLFLNFTASHDGVGVRPLEGLVPGEEIEQLLRQVKERGGRVSYKANTDRSQSPYELNITYFDALRDGEEWGADEHIERFLCSQTVALELRGVPAVYVHSLTATPNDYEARARTGQNRSLHRRSWSLRELDALLDDSSSTTSRVFHEYCRRLRVRREHPAFHPLADQDVLDAGPGVLAVRRSDAGGEQTILCLNNFTDEPQQVARLDPGGPGRDLLGRFDGFPTTLPPYGSCWWCSGEPPARGDDETA